MRFRELRSLLLLPLSAAVALTGVAEESSPRVSNFVAEGAALVSVGEPGHSPEVSPRQVSVRVRIIKATEPIELGGAAAAQVVEPGIYDLAPKLDKVAFRQFRLLTSLREEIGLKRKAVFDLVEGQSLVVRPLYVEGRRTGLWLKWLDRGGGAILDTRTHFSCGESLITGTDHAADTGLLLAIDVEPSP